MEDPCLQVVIGSNACLEPFAMAKAGTVLPAGGCITAQSIAEGAAKKQAKGPAAPVLAALRTELPSEPLGAAAAAALQVRSGCHEASAFPSLACMRRTICIRQSAASVKSSLP